MITLVDEFEVLGVPAPQGSKTRMPNGAMLDGKSPAARAKHRAWRSAVAEVARDLAGETPHDGPLQLQVTFRLPMPQSRPARARRAGLWPHATKPDLDKLLRSTLDGLEDGGLIRDDSRICAMEVDAWEVIDWTGALITLRQVDVPEVAA
jgi:Holliday junction resolvase RusA-like endonuclease